MPPVENEIVNVEASNSPNSVWDTQGRRAVWVSDARQAEKFSSAKGLQSPPKATPVSSRESESAALHKFRKIGLFTIAASVVSLVLIVAFGRECYFALAYRDHLNAGLLALSEGRADQAQVEFSMSISADPKASDAYYYRAVSEVDQRSHGNALNDYKKALELDPKNLKAYLARGALFMKMHSYDETVNDCSSALKLNPSYTEAYRLRANAYNYLYKLDNAISDSTIFLNQYEHKDEHTADALAKRAYALYQKREFEAAVTDYTDAIVCDPHNGALYAGRAIAYMQLEKWKLGLSDSTVAISLRPNDAAIYKVRGICNAKLNLADDSLSDLDKLVSLHPTVDTHRLRGDQRLMAHDYLGSLQDYDYVLQAEPDDQKTGYKYQRSKIALQKMATKTSAVADAEPRARMPRAADLQISEVALVKKGYELYMSGDNEPAIKYLSAAIQANPRDPAARRYLAYALVHGGINKDAVAQFESLAILGSFLPGDKLLFANALVGCGQSAKAIDLYNDLIASDPTNHLARTNLIKTLIDKGSTVEAAKIAAEGSRQSPAQHSHYSDLYQQAVANKAPKAVAM